LLTVCYNMFNKTNCKGDNKMDIKLCREIIKQCNKDIKELQKLKQDAKDIFKIRANAEFLLRKELQK
jgi:hypothetical protein